MSDSIYAFHISTLEKALNAWKKEQLAAYPHQVERIETTVLAMMDFMTSDHIKKNKMLVEPTNPHKR